MADIFWWDRKAEVFILAGEALFPDFGPAEQLIDYRILSSFFKSVSFVNEIGYIMLRLVVLVFFAPLSEILFASYHPLDCTASFQLCFSFKFCFSLKTF